MLAGRQTVSSLRPGYISGHEAVRRIAAVMAGPGIKLQEADWACCRLISKADGRLVIQQEMAAEFQNIPYLRIREIKSLLLRKDQIIATCSVTEKIVPESGIDRLESLLAEKGCVMAVKPLILEPVCVSLVGQSNCAGKVTLSLFAFRL